MSDWQSYKDERETMFIEPQTQEPQVNETAQENPAVSKLREAFEVARNAIIDGSELAKQVEGLRKTVDQLGSEVSLLQRDLEYVRSRNKELDEQVTEVRRQRDNAIEDAKRQEERAITAEAATSQMRGLNYTQSQRLETLEMLLANAAKERDDAMTMALEYESKLKAAEAKLAKLKVTFGEAFGEPTPETHPGMFPEKPKPHYEVQPRDEVGKFQPFDEEKTYPHGSQGESSF